MSRKKQGATRREFLKTTALAPPLLAGTAAGQVQRTDLPAILAALGDTLIPSRPDRPGYRDLEPHGITDEMWKALRPMGEELFSIFNRSCRPFFEGRSFVALTEEERARFLHRVIQGQGFPDQALLETVRRVYRLTRIAAFRIFYSNFPENRIPRDTQGLPILPAGDQHQVTAPNSKDLVTGWDIAGFRGPLTWEQEQNMRERMKRIHWHENPEELVVRYRPLSPPGRRED